MKATNNINESKPFIGTFFSNDRVRRDRGGGGGCFESPKEARHRLCPTRHKRAHTNKTDANTTNTNINTTTPTTIPHCHNQRRRSCSKALPRSMNSRKAICTTSE